MKYEHARSEVVTVGTASVQVAIPLAVEQRQEIIFTNTSTAGQVISLAAGITAVAGQGIVLQPNQSYAASLDSAYRPFNETWNAIASAAAGTLAVFER